MSANFRSISRAVAVSLVLASLVASGVGAQAGAPTVTISPASGEYALGAQIAVTVTYCDNNGLDTATAVLQLDGVAVNWPKVVFPPGNPGPCLAKVTQSGTVTLSTPSRTLRASIEDTSPSPLWSGWTLVTWTTPVPWSGGTVSPEQQYLETAPATVTTLAFRVTNVGPSTQSVSSSAAGTGLDSVGVPQGPGKGGSAFSLLSGASALITVAVKSSSTNLSTGRLTLTVTNGSQVATAFSDVTSRTPAPLVSGLALLNPTGITEKSLCVTIAAGPGAAQCGDLRLAHAMPGVTTKNRFRAPTLLYSANAAQPTVLIPAELTVTSVTPNVQYTASVRITAGPDSGLVLSAGSWSSNDWGSGGRRRITASFDGSALSTGRHPYLLTIQRSAGVTDTASGELLHVNRLASPFTAGWWLAGLEQLVSYQSSNTAIERMMWIGGDGSARVFRETAVNSCIFTHDALDRPDSIVGTVSGTGCTARQRRSSNGIRVVFDDLGNHVQTINRIGETTTFTYGGGLLQTITLPTGTLARQYQLAYTNGLLDSVTAPDVPGGWRTVRIRRNTGMVVAGSSRSRILAIRESATDSVRFTYVGGSGNGAGGYRVATRADRMGIATTFTYDAANRLASASTPATASQTVTTTFRMAEGQATAQALIADSVYTRLDGPRADVTDVHKWWINRLGAPVRTRNPVGMESIVTYDATWPALAAKVIDAAGVTNTATYNARGLLTQSTVVAPFGIAQGNAVTTVKWNAVWDLPDTLTDPNGVRTARRYDVATGNLLSEWVGSDSGRATRYEYDAVTKQLLRIFTPASGTADRIQYDPELGNVAKTKSPRGDVITHTRDRIGRDTLVVVSVDGVTDTTTKVQRIVTHYDSAGRAWETITASPAMPYMLEYDAQLMDNTPVTADTQFVRTTFDREGRPLTINAFSRPDQNVWDVCDAPVGECVGVPAGTEGSYDIREYDWLGRPTKQRLGSGPKQVYYDPAGNVDSAVTRNNHVLRSKYDAANRLVQRLVPSVTYPQTNCTDMPYGIRYPSAPFPTCLMRFPYYPNGADSSLVVGADTARFVFDAAGRLVRADNKDARVSRSYFASGALMSETQRIRSYGTSNFDVTSYYQSYRYDLGGRRVAHVLPTNLAGADSIAYVYDSDRGFLRHVVHGLDRISLTLDAAGRQDSLLFATLQSGNYVTGVVETRGYDPDGNLVGLQRVRRNGASMVALSNSALTLDARARIRSVASGSAAAEVDSQQTRIRYAGSGAVLASERWKTNSVWFDVEQFRVTALGDVWRSRADIGSQPTKFPVVSQFSVNGALKKRTPVRPGLNPPAEAAYTDTTATTYDLAGNAIRTVAIFQRYQDLGDRYYSASRSYYTGDNRLAVHQKYHSTDAASTGSWEEYRYDALGRRVLTRARRGTTGDPYRWMCAGSTTCDYYIERTVWDGDQVLFELRANGHDTLTAAQLDAHYGTGLNWGKVGYVHAGGIDKPLMTLDGRVPTYNWRGLPESSVWTTGAPADCSVQSGGSCTTVAWSSGSSVYMKQYPYAPGGSNPPQWVGTVLTDAAGSSGLMYRRNRYYDPGSGQFTQQDPIGIAGGTNVYGFAGGDPVNFADPFGLCFGPLAVPCARVGLFWLTRGAPLAAAAGAAMTDLQAPSVPQITANRLVGLAAETRVAGQLLEEGYKILGQHVGARTAAGLRVIDILAQAPDGARVAIEVKSGGAIRNAAQLAKDWLMSTEGATLVGKNAGRLKGESVILETLVRNP